MKVFQLHETLTGSASVLEEEETAFESVLTVVGATVAVGIRVLIVEVVVAEVVAVVVAVLFAVVAVLFVAEAVVVTVGAEESVGPLMASL